MDSEEAILRWLEPDESGASGAETHAPDLNLTLRSRVSRLVVVSPRAHRRLTAPFPFESPILAPRVPRAAASLLSRTLTDPVLTGIPFVDAHGAMRAGQLVEVCGVGGSGKTEILMQAAVNCALPREREGVRFGGCESSVLLLDLDGKFDTLRLLKILTARVEAALARESARRKHGAVSNASEEETANALVRLSDAVYRESVGRFQMVRCHNSLDFLKALAVVDKIFERRERDNAKATRETKERESTKNDGSDDGSAPPRRLLLVDNVAAFYWLDRASRREHDAPLSLHNVHHASAKALMDISRRCRAPVVATKAVASAMSAFGVDKNASGAFEGSVDRNTVRNAHKDFLPPKWTSAVTQRLVLEPEPTFLSGEHSGYERADSGAETSVGARDGDLIKNFQGRGGFGTSFVARWELPAGRPSARYRVDGEAGIRVVA
jgi:hypothetical protein